MTASNELKALTCPFCGSPAEEHTPKSGDYQDDPDVQPTYSCSARGCMASHYCMDLVDWNQRARPASSAQGVALEWLDAPFNISCEEPHYYEVRDANGRLFFKYDTDDAAQDLAQAQSNDLRTIIKVLNAALSAPPQAQGMPFNWLIWSGEWKAWWCAGGRGYTGVEADAGRFTREEAERHFKGCGPEKQLQLVPEAALTAAPVDPVDKAGWLTREELERLHEAYPGMFMGRAESIYRMALHALKVTQ